MSSFQLVDICVAEYLLNQMADTQRTIMSTEAKELLNTQENLVCIVNPPVGPDPIRMTCPHCQTIMSTYIENKASARTHTLCIVLSLLGCFICAPCVYCNEDYLAKEHFCVKCGKYVGTYDG